MRQQTAKFIERNTHLIKQAMAFHIEETVYKYMLNATILKNNLFEYQEEFTKEDKRMNNKQKEFLEFILPPTFLLVLRLEPLAGCAFYSYRKQ